MKSWTCIENCGACCKLDLQEREGIYDILNNEDLKLIYSMTAKDGWCKHFDKESKKCGIYIDRPHFCRVNEFSNSFNEYKKNGDKFLINCCKQHIESIYGKKSDQMNSFKKEINSK